MPQADFSADILARAAKIRLAVFDVDGTLTDGQFGTTDRLQSENLGDGHNTQWTQELRLQSNFDGPAKNFTPH